MRPRKREDRALLLVVLAVIPAFARAARPQDTEPSVRSRLEAARIAVADSIAYHVRVESPPGRVRLEGDVRLALRDADVGARGYPYRFSFEGCRFDDAGEWRRAEVATDGSIVQRLVLIEGEAVYEQTDILGPAGFSMIVPLQHALVFELVDPKRVARLIEELERGDAAGTVLPAAAIGGIVCHRVKLERIRRSWEYLSEAEIQGLSDEEKEQMEEHFETELAIGVDDSRIRRMSDTREDVRVTITALRGAGRSAETISLRSEDDPARQWVDPSRTSAEDLLLDVGTEAPSWSLKDANGRTHSLEEYRGRLVVVDFWATWCQPCRAAMPHVEALHREMKERGVAVLGVDVFEKEDADDVADGVARIMEAGGFTYPMLLDGDEVARAYGVQALPTLYLIGREGRVVHRGTGAGQLEEIRIRLERELEGD